MKTAKVGIDAWRFGVVWWQLRGLAYIFKEITFFLTTPGIWTCVFFWFRDSGHKWVLEFEQKAVSFTLLKRNWLAHHIFMQSEPAPDGTAYTYFPSARKAELDRPCHPVISFIYSTMYAQDQFDWCSSVIIMCGWCNVFQASIKDQL